MYSVLGTVKSRAFRVLWALEELGEPYTQYAEPPHSALVCKHSPLGKIPVLLDGRDAIFDSTAIITYLADKHNKLSHPAGTIARARQDGLTQMINDQLDSVLWIASRLPRLSQEETPLALETALRADFAQSVDQLMRLMGDGPYLMGEHLTLPDILAVHCGGWAHQAGFSVRNEKFLAYSQRARRRSGYQAARQRR